MNMNNINTIFYNPTNCGSFGEMLDYTDIIQIKTLSKLYTIYINSEGYNNMMGVLYNNQTVGISASQFANDLIHNLDQEQLHAVLYYDAPATYCLDTNVVTNFSSVLAGYGLPHLIILVLLTRHVVTLVTRLDINMASLAFAIHRFMDEFPYTTLRQFVDLNNRTVIVVKRVLLAMYENICDLYNVITTKWARDIHTAGAYIFSRLNQLRIIRDRARGTILNSGTLINNVITYLDELSLIIRSQLDDLEKYSTAYRQPNSLQGLIEKVRRMYKQHFTIFNSPLSLLTVSLLVVSGAYVVPPDVIDFIKQSVEQQGQWKQGWVNRPSTEIFKMGVSFASEMFGIDELILCQDNPAASELNKLTLTNVEEIVNLFFNIISAKVFPHKRILVMTYRDPTERFNRLHANSVRNYERMRQIRRLIENNHETLTRSLRNFDRYRRPPSVSCVQQVRRLLSHMHDSYYNTFSSPLEENSQHGPTGSGSTRPVFRLVVPVIVIAMQATDILPVPYSPDLEIHNLITLADQVGVDSAQRTMTQLLEAPPITPTGVGIDCNFDVQQTVPIRANRQDPVIELCYTYSN